MLTIQEAEKLIHAMAAARRVLHDATNALEDLGYVDEVEQAEDVYSNAQYWLEDWLEEQGNKED